MCGLFGRLNLNKRDVNFDESVRILNILTHRGPDDFGFYHNKHVFLGHRRLSIIDLEGGKQPLYNEDNNLVLIGNGEIYNYKELRDELISKGHKFRTNSDTEVLVHLYEEERELFLSRLNGMFAFAVYDIKSNTLFLARDRIGIKPLYYYYDGEQFIFSSEMKAIIKSGLIPLEVDDNVVYRFLTLHHSVPPNTLIKGMKSLKAGHYIVIKNRPGEQVQYWDIELRDNNVIPSYHETYKQVEQMLFDSVEKRLMSDVPLGLFLSGGTDSSLVAVLMNKIVGKGIKTFSIGFKEKGFSEIPYSRKVSSMISSDHMEIIVTPKDIMNNIETVIWYRETPISEVSDIPIYLLSKAASQVVKVVLTGEGGDEVFGGYKKYVFEKIANYSGLLANSYVRSLYRNKIAKRLIPQRLGTAIDLLAERDKYQRFYKWFSFFHEEELQNMIVKNKRHLLNSPNVFEQLVKSKELKTSVEEMRYLDIKVWLPDNLLLRGDRMSMACSLEARVPFLDHRIVEMSFSLPLHLKINNFSGKYIIKKIAEKYLDREIIYRKKIGFEVPVSEWFRTDLKDLLVSHLIKDNSFCSNYIEKYIIEKMIHEHVNAKRDHHKKLWILLNLELWHDKFLRN